MMSSPASMPSRGVCRFYQSGGCRNGTRCSFIHVGRDDDAGDSLVVCPYFQRGSCAFGASCRNSHECVDVGTLPNGVQNPSGLDASIHTPSLNFSQCVQDDGLGMIHVLLLEAINFPGFLTEHNLMDRLDTGYQTSTPPSSISSPAEGIFCHSMTSKRRTE